jgi:hypothetical protein
MLRFFVRGERQKLRHRLVEFGAEEADRVDMFREVVGGHDDIGIDGPVRNVDAMGKYLAPALGLAHRVLIADHHSRLKFHDQLFERVMGRPADDERDVARLEVFPHVDKALAEEVVVAQVGVRKVADGGEERDDRQPQFVAERDGHVERWIVDAALGALHPVEDAFGVPQRSAASAHGDARVGGEHFKRFGHGLNAWSALLGRRLRLVFGMVCGLVLAHGLFSKDANCGVTEVRRRRAPFPGVEGTPSTLFAW